MKKENFLKVIAASLLAVLATPFALLLTFWKKKGEDSAESRNKTVDELIAQYGDPDDLVLLDASRGNEAEGVVLVYDKGDFLIINGEKINKSDISEVTFKNAAIAYLPDDYQVVLNSKNPKIPPIQLHVGYERKWAMKIVEQLQHHLSLA
ncbi:MAG: hypothetical protein IKS72_02695 [Prevotella sp.]|nr:hypothetical protein [Prevotella sp.]MBR5918669.1 hypothetical protein [Prevotella sp.]MBR6015974.1 hypothetical protein [Prevotella sp.]MBR6455825.1 hypothetical protein [Prevotella sp.]